MVLHIAKYYVKISVPRRIYTFLKIKSVSYHICKYVYELSLQKFHMPSSNYALRTAIKIIAWYTVLLEKVIQYARLVSNFPTFYGTRMLIAVFTTAAISLCPEPEISNLQGLFCKIHFNMTLPFTRRYS